MNPDTTGLTGVNLFVRPDELDLFHALKTELADSLQPATAHERLLFDLALTAAWNLRRCAAIEAELQSEAHALGLPDAFFDDALSKKLDRVIRYRSRHETSYRRAMDELKRLTAARLPDPPAKARKSPTAKSKPAPAHPEPVAAEYLASPVAPAPSVTLHL